MAKPEDKFDVTVAVTVTRRNGDQFFKGTLEYPGMDLGQVAVVETAMADLGVKLAKVGVKQAEMLGFKGVDEAVKAMG